MTSAPLELLTDENYIFNDVFSQALIGKWFYKLDVEEYYYSNSFKTIYNLANNEKVDRNYLLQVIHPDDLELVQSTVSEAILKKSSFSLEYRIIVKEKIKYIKTIGQYKKVEDQATLYGITQDITSQIENEIRIKNLADELTRSNQDLEQFAFVASHDLQEPLRKIRSFGGLLADELKDNQQEDVVFYIERMQNAAERMQKLISDLLIFARASRKNSGIEKISLQELISTVVDDLSDSITLSNSTINYKKLGSLEANETSLRQLFQNLISNSIKFRKADHPAVITISSKNVTMNDNLRIGKKIRAIEITVEDNGIGFDQKYAEKVFTIFSRLHGKSKFDGTGIGLAICKKVVDLHHGIISVKSKEGVGTTFKVILPKKQKHTWKIKK